MKREHDYFSLLGLASDARPEEVEVRYQEIIKFLSSPAVPAQLEQWAAEESALVEEAYAVVVDASAAEPHLASFGPAAPKRPARAASPANGGLRRFARPLIGVALIAAVAGGFWISRLDRGSSPSSTQAAQQQKDPNAPIPLDMAKVSQWMATVQQDPSNVDALFSLGEAYFDAQQWQTSIDWLTKVVGVDPKNVYAISDIGTANFNMGKYDVARSTWQKGLEVAPTDPQLHYNLGFLAANSEPPDYVTARKEWQAVIDNAPDSNLAKTVQVHMSSLPTQ